MYSENDNLQARITELGVQLAEARTCGLCGEQPTERNHLFICCENCTDIGVSNVPKEVFELQRQLADAKKAAEKFILLVDKCDLHGPAIQCREASNELAKAIGFTMKERVARHDSPSTTRK